MYFDEFKHQLPDIDPDETDDWIASLDQVVAEEGEARARFLIYKLLKRARQLQVGLPPLTQTRYINTISPEQEPAFPGDEEMERRIRRLIRWNAVAMVLRANNQFSGIGGHLATYASAATLYEVGFNHFFRGKDDGGSGDQIFYQGHAAPGIYARAFLEGRLSVDQLDHFRRETGPGKGLSSYPHPRLMPDFWEFPTVSMGLGPISAIYQARYNRYLHNRGLLDTSDSRVWAFLGDGETDEPESLGALHVASREGLDNLTFVVNCNLQRLDGPVRGNGKIIQELESAFRGAGWNVIKVIWGREWDDLLARDVDGLLVQQMNETLDGEFQKFSVAGGAYIREHFFGPDPRLRKLVEHLSDDDLAKLRRGGHDYRKVYAAYKAATEHTGAPTVILAQTVKGWTLGPGVEARNITHQAKKLNEAELQDLPRPARAADPGRRRSRTRRTTTRAPTPRRSSTSSSGAGRSAARCPRRIVRAAAAARPGRRRSTPSSPPAARRRSRRRWSSPGSCATSSATRSSGRGSCRSSRTRRGPSAWTRCSRRSASTRRSASATSRSTRTSSCRTARRPTARSSRRASPRPARWPASRRPARRTRRHGLATIPFYIFYSMFGFQRTGDQMWAFGDARGRGFLMGATAGRTTLTGEGLQHDDGHTQILASTVPNLRAYDPAFAYELAAVVRDGIERMYGAEARGRLLLRHDLQRELRPAGRGPRASPTRRSCAASTASPRHPTSAATRTRPGSSAPARSSSRSSPRATCWPRSSASPPRSTAPRRSRCCAATRSRPSAGTGSTPTPKTPRVPYVSTILPHDGGPIVAATDWMKALPDMVSRWLPPHYVALGTDGFGRSDTREDLRALFEIDPPHIAAATLVALARCGALPAARGRQGDPRARHRPRQDGSAGPLTPAASAPAARRHASDTSTPVWL